jgi:hypothetical protein
MDYCQKYTKGQQCEVPIHIRVRKWNHDPTVATSHNAPTTCHIPQFNLRHDSISDIKFLKPLRDTLPTERKEYLDK